MDVQVWNVWDVWDVPVCLRGGLWTLRNVFLDLLVVLA